MMTISCSFKHLKFKNGNKQIHEHLLIKIRQKETCRKIKYNLPCKTFCIISHGFQINMPPKFCLVLQNSHHQVRGTYIQKYYKLMQCFSWHPHCLELHETLYSTWLKTQTHLPRDFSYAKQSNAHYENIFCQGSQSMKLVSVVSWFSTLEMMSDEKPMKNYLKDSCLQ